MHITKTPAYKMSTKLGGREAVLDIVVDALDRSTEHGAKVDKLKGLDKRALERDFVEVTFALFAFALGALSIW